MELAKRTKVTKGMLGRMRFMYNPSNFKDTIGVNYNELKSAGMSYPLLQYGGGKTRYINFDIYLNDKVKPGVTKEAIAYLHGFIPKAEQGEKYQFHAPRSITFAFGWFVKDCLLNNMNIDYQEFTPDLEPLKAVVSIELIIIQ